MIRSGLAGNAASRDRVLAFSLSLAIATCAAAASPDCRKVLNVDAYTTDAGALKKAYRREALKWHPDKNSAPDAEERFREVSHCYEILTNPSATRVANRAGGFDGGMQAYDRSRAFRTFEDLFGDVHSSWRPGMTVSGTLVSNGKRVKLTIHPDGTTEEQESAASGKGSYSSVYKSDGHSTSITIDGDPREFLMDQLKASGFLPAGLVSIVSMLLFTICSPWVCCAGCVYCCCVRGSKANID